MTMFEVRSHTTDACNNISEQGDTSYAVEQEGAIWRLLRKDDGDMTEEVVTSFQGILCKKDLPPLWDWYGMDFSCSSKEMGKI
jgi:hypothetical protein